MAYIFPIYNRVGIKSQNVTILFWNLAVLFRLVIWPCPLIQAFETILQLLILIFWHRTTLPEQERKNLASILFLKAWLLVSYFYNGIWGGKFERYHYFLLVIIFYVTDICQAFITPWLPFYSVHNEKKKHQGRIDTFHEFILRLEFMYIISMIF